MEGECSVDMEGNGNMPLVDVLKKAESLSFAEFRPTKTEFYDDEYHFGRRGEFVHEVKSVATKDEAKPLKDGIDVV